MSRQTDRQTDVCNPG